MAGGLTSPARAAEANITCLFQYLIFAYTAGQMCGLTLDQEKAARYFEMRHAIEARDPRHSQVLESNREYEESIRQQKDSPRLCPMARGHQRGLNEFTSDEGYKMMMERLDVPEDPFTGSCR